MNTTAPPRSDAFYEFAARNILDSSSLAPHLTNRPVHAGCAFCADKATHRMKLVKPAGEFYTCQRHFAGAGIEGNPE